MKNSTEWFNIRLDQAEERISKLKAIHAMSKEKKEWERTKKN